MDDMDQLVHADVFAATKHALPSGAAASSIDAGPAGQDVNATPTLDAIDAQVARLADADLETGALSHAPDQVQAMMTPGKGGKKGKKAPKKGKKAASQQQQQQQAMQPPMQPIGHPHQGQHAHFQPSLAHLAAKQAAAAGTGTGAAGDGQSANGMQSLLSAIELDLTGQGGSFQDREREYLELMHTQFTEEHHERVANNEEFEGEPVDYGLSQLAQANAQGLQTNDLPMNLQLPLMQQQHAAHQHYHQQSQQQQAQHQQQRIRPASAAMTMPTPPINRKRKWPGFVARWQDPAARLARIRQVITDHLPLLLKQDYGGQAPPPISDNRLVTLSCNYAQIGQKSYGHEKRFLTPPPYCTILGHFGPLLGEVPVAHMSVHADIGTQSILQTAERDANGHIYFKQLHINAGSVGKSKKFSLRLQVAARGARHPAHVPFADFDTDDIFIISKATKKSTKSRMQVPVIRHGGLIALYNRINSQTVRTKYLGEEYGSMILKSESWSPFRIDLFEPGEPDAQGNIPIPYGARVSLSNMETGFVSEPLVVKRVENNLIEEQDQGFVSQMQKLIFERWSPEMQTGGYDGHGQPQATDAGGVGGALDPSLEDQDYGSRYVADPAAEDTSVEQQAANLLPRYTHASGVNQFEQDETQAPVMDASGNLQAMQAASDAAAAPDAAQDQTATPSAADAMTTTTTAAGDTTTTPPVRYGSRLYLSASRAQRMMKELAGAQADPTTCWDHATLDPRGIPQADDPLCWLVVGVTQFEFSFLDCLDGALPEPEAEAAEEVVPDEATQMQPDLGMSESVLDPEAQQQQPQQATALEVQEEGQGDEPDDATTSRGGRRKRTRRGDAASTSTVAASPSKRRRRTGKEADLPASGDATVDAVTTVDETAMMRPDDADDKMASLPAAPSETQSEPGMIQTTVDALMSAELPQELEPDFAAINGALQNSQQQQPMQGPDEMEPDGVHVETAITPFPVLEARPSVLSNGRLFLLVNHFLQPGSHLAPLEVWLGSVGPLAITRMTQDVTHQTLSAVSSGFVALEVAMPSAQEMLHHKKVPLLFVRQDGLVYISGCEIVIQDGGHSVMDVEEL